jgi:hypothetical protein
MWIGSAFTHVAAFADQAQNKAEYESDLRSRQTTLAHASVVGGIHLPAGSIVTHGSNDPNELAAVDLPTATIIHGIPLTGHVAFSYGDLDGSETLARDAQIGEAFCAANGTTRFSSGKLVECRLARPSRIRGVPCTGIIDFENGIVCVLSATYQRYGYSWRPGTKITDYGGLVWFRIGALAPTLLAFSAPLAPDSEVQFNHGTVASVDLRTSGGRFRGCTFDLIMVEKGKTVGRTTGTCPLPIPAGNLYVPLPATVIGRSAGPRSF